MMSKICLKITQGTVDRDPDKEENGHTRVGSCRSWGWWAQEFLTLPSLRLYVSEPFHYKTNKVNALLSQTEEASTVYDRS